MGNGISHYIKLRRIYPFLSISLIQLSTTQSCQKERPGFHGERMSHVTKRQELSLIAKVASSVEGLSHVCAQSEQTDKLFFTGLQSLSTWSRRDRGGMDFTYTKNERVDAIDKTGCLRGGRFRGRGWRLHGTGKSTETPITSVDCEESINTAISRSLRRLMIVFFLFFFFSFFVFLTWFDERLVEISEDWFYDLANEYNRK